jgi:hypothetical protein
MSNEIHFAVVAGWLLLAIASLLWFTACAIVANKMEREGVVFWKAFVACFLLTPLVGLLTLGVTRLMRPDRPLVQTATRAS